MRTAGRALTRPLPRAEVLDRERTRTRLLFAALVMTVITVPLFASTDVEWPVFWVTVFAVGVTAVASLVPAFWSTFNRVGGVLIAAEITSLVVATGGAGSPYDVLYGMLLIYATMFYGTRRLVTTAILLVVLWVVPHAFGVGMHSHGHWRAAVVEVAVWAVVATVVHGLMQRIRDQSRALAASEQRYRSLFVHNPEGVFSLDREGRFTTMNAAGARLLGLSPEQMIGSSFHPFVAVEELAAVEERFGAALVDGAQTYETTVVDVRGRHIPGEVTNVPIVVEGEVVGVHGIVRDLSENKALVERLEHQSFHDPLTGLANRTLLGDRLDHALESAKRTAEPVAVLVLDLNEFKAINDTHGHHTGDALLVDVATRLGACIRPGDTVARLGGDEFALVLPEADQRIAAQVAQRVLDAVSTPVVIDDLRLAVGTSIGIAISSPGRQDGDHLLRDADQAMYTAKRRGKGRFVVFSPSANIADDMPAGRRCG